MQRALEIFRVKLLILIQLETLISSVFRVSFIHLRSCPWMKIFVSSAKMRKSSLLEQRVISFMYNRNKIGPKIDPCGAPYHIYTVQ